jgi:hypothetical protein
VQFVTLVLAIKVNEGLVLAADSKVSCKSPRKDAAKVLTFKNKKNHGHVGALVSGTTVLNESTQMPDKLLPELEAELPPHRLSVEEYANRFHDFFIVITRMNGKNTLRKTTLSRFCRKQHLLLQALTKTDT